MLIMLSRAPVEVSAKVEGDGEEVVVGMRACRASMHNHAPASKAAGMAMSPHRASPHARQSVPA